jgi:protein involved in polysaccharide export with SLBB domain
MIATARRLTGSACHVRKNGDRTPKSRVLSPFLLLLLFLAGCAAVKPHVDSMMQADRNTTHEDPKIAHSYAVECPDVLDLVIPGHPELSHAQTVGVDGRINLGPFGRLLVEGQSVVDVAANIAQVTQTLPSEVQVSVASYRSQQIFLFGQVAGTQRAVAYRGPETVQELLQRVGGISAGAAPENVTVIRSHVADGRQPEVFHVDLRAIVADHDQRTNVRLAPFDQIYVGQNRRSTMEKCVPPCLQPVYELFCGLYRAS